MKIRYFTGLVFTALVLVFTGRVCGGGFFIFIEITSILIAIIFPLVFMLIMYGRKEISASFSVLFNETPDKKVLENAKGFFENYRKTENALAVAAFIINIIVVFATLEYKETLLVNIAVALIVLLYAGIINIAIIIPYNIIIHKKIMEMEK
ncbi:MAG: hypothetical protein LBO04_00640 [Spirochaetaceae bacterium]|jgi:hypothetical protein|nr:hypothetical protein [Spirochaetaceae bacterium]